MDFYTREILLIQTPRRKKNIYVHIHIIIIMIIIIALVGLLGLVRRCLLKVVEDWIGDI